MIIALCAALAIGLTALATAWAQSKIGAAGAGSLAEKPELTGTIVILVVLMLHPCLDLLLHGRGGDAGAVLEDSTGQAFYRIKQKLPDGSAIVKVMRDRVSIRRSDGVTVSLDVVDETTIVTVQKPGTSGDAGVKRLSDGKWIVDQKEVPARTENMNQILTHERALP